MLKIHFAPSIAVLPALLTILRFTGFSQQTGEDILKRMHEKYREGMCRNYTFSQRNSHYQNDTLIGPSVWHESVGLPDKFRIVFGDSAKGNMVLFRNDSVFRYRNNKVLKASSDSNNLLLVPGGMYYRDFNDVKRRLSSSGYDLSKSSERQWNKKKVWVVGAGPEDDHSNQLWIDKDDLKVVRIIERLNEKEMMDMRFESHQKWCRGFVENKVSFRRNGLLEQVEEYYDLKERTTFW
jgi:hypothetical protein